MADEEHLVWLKAGKEGVKAWNSWMMLEGIVNLLRLIVV
jgi:hypothetical protein